MVFGYGVCDLSASDVSLQSTLGLSAPSVGLGCHRRLYTYRITQADEDGANIF